MSNWNPTEPYIYQPEPPIRDDGTRNETIYGLSGPGAEAYYGKRYTKADAEKELEKLKANIMVNDWKNKNDRPS